MIEVALQTCEGSKMLAPRNSNGILPGQFHRNCFSCYEISVTDCRRGLKRK
jgi:hypothetical protein